jgi:hypothetical protein
VIPSTETGDTEDAIPLVNPDDTEENS